MPPTHIPVPPGADPVGAEYFARLEALQHGHKEGWFDYRAGDLFSGRYVVEFVVEFVDVPAQQLGQRVLHRDAAWWWILGFADGYGHGDDLLTEPVVPDLLTVDEAAERLGMSRENVGRLIDTRDLYCAYPHNHRWLIAAQIDARLHPDNDEAQQHWTALRNRWPNNTRLRDLATPPTASTPTVEEDTFTPAQRITRLDRAEDAALIRYLFCDPDTDTYGLHVHVDGGIVRRELPAHGVWPWLQGFADQRGRTLAT